MSVLSDIDLKRILNSNDGIVILRRCEKNITGLGYDLTIGFICDAATGKQPAIFTDKNNIDRYTLLAGHRYLVISKEFLYLSSQYMATLHSRGSYALKGIMVASTTVDPNYAGCITSSLFNYTSEDIHIKKENTFVTMVFHTLCTSTDSLLSINERGNPMDTQETFQGSFPNIHPEACKAGDLYFGHIRKIVEPEYRKALREMYQKIEANTETNKKKQTSVEKNFIEEKLVKEVPEEAKMENRKNIKITFLFGNGFDLNVGLKTSYKDFCTYYIAENPDDLLAEEMTKNRDDWSDLELALGQVTEKVTPEKRGEFWKSEENMENYLVKYLIKENNRINIESSEMKRRTADEICNSLKYFYRKDKEEIASLKEILEDGNNSIEYAFISFNYTDTLEKCLKTLVRSSEYDVINISHYKDENDRLQDVLHIHGSIHDGSMVLGVNDESQIANEDFKDISSKKCLIKSVVNVNGVNNREKGAFTIIDSSSVICIFGMSLGKTDQMWWNYIAEWLQWDQSRELVIFSKMITGMVHKYDESRKERILNIFFENGNISLDIQKKIRNQIHVVINADLFHIRLVDES